MSVVPNQTRSNEWISLPDEPSLLFNFSSFLRRFYASSLATLRGSATNQLAVQHTVDPCSQADDITQYTSSSAIPANTTHTYNLTSLWRGHATIVVMSRATNVWDPPLLHLGEELNGFIVLPSGNLSDLQTMEVVVG